jgi:pimeloyl-ACP methyl ester carboxylesterase
MNTRRLRFALWALTAMASTPAMGDMWSGVERGHADSDGVKIHYAAAGEGPLVVMIHGFPDFWYTWRHQMEGLKDHYRVVAIDQRGYNRSDAPPGKENYAMSYLVSDVAAVIRHLGYETATVVGHDWGGMVAWAFAFRHPEMLDNLIVLNLPHPNGLAREWASDPSAQSNQGYARAFQKGSPSDPDIFFGGPMTPETLSGWVTDQAARARYIEAFERSDFDAMLAYYKMNYPPPADPDAPPRPLPPNVSVPVLIFHGLEDRALPSGALNDTWKWVDQDLTIVTIPAANHFVQQDAAERVTTTMKWWLRTH